MKGPSSRSSDAAKDRRAQSGQRVHFEAMVAVGGAEGGAAFEAESVDVSSQGMRLRTAYLPVVGDQLVCRFDGPDGELIAIGEVLWATEQQKGGEFGLKFVDLDPATEEALKALSVGDSAADAAPEDAQQPKPRVAKNARVKLHIEGLASPMKARVQGGDDKQVCVGSSLEFLKLGRQVEVEDVDVGDRREGFVDAVKVEVDPATSVPQLVVTLRFDAARLGAAVPSKSSRDDKPAEQIEPAPITRVAGFPGPGAREAEAPKAPKSVKKEPAKAASAAPTDAASALDGSAEDDDDMMPPNKLRAAQDAAKDFTTKAASKIGPAFSRVGDGARGFLASIRGTMDKRREARQEAKKASAPRRVTAPPPSGALTSEGRRVVRQDQGKDADEEPASVAPRRSRRGIVIGASAGLALVLGIVGVTKAFNGNDDPAPQAAVSSADARKPTGTVPPIPGAPAIADVPLYGATPLSTIEQVIPPPPAASAAKADAGDAGDAGEPAEKSELSREWGHGELKDAKTFKVKMDAAVEGFRASELEDGFSIVVPKRQSMSTSSALVRKDKRLSAVDVENREDGVEIRMKFKGEPPAYRVKVRSDRVEISLGGEGTTGKAKAAPAKKTDPKKVAAKPSPKKKKGDKKAPAAKKP